MHRVGVKGRADQEVPPACTSKARYCPSSATIPAPVRNSGNLPERIALPPPAGAGSASPRCRPAVAGPPRSRGRDNPADHGAEGSPGDCAGTGGGFRRPHALSDLEHRSRQSLSLIPAWMPLRLAHDPQGQLKIFCRHGQSGLRARLGCAGWPLPSLHTPLSINIGAAVRDGKR